MTLRYVRNALLAVFGVLVLLDVAAVCVLLSPVGRSREAREKELTKLQSELEQKRKEAMPARDMDKKLLLAGDQVTEFSRKRLLSRYSDVSQSLNKMAGESHVQVLAVKYDAHDSGLAGVQKLTMAAIVRGSYTSQMEFINALERSPSLYIVDGVAFGGGQPNDVVMVQLKLDTYLRNAGSGGGL